MNVATQYKTEAKFYAGLNAPQPTVAERSAIELIMAQKERLEAGLLDNHEARHAANMAAWCELHTEHLAAGRFDIAANIMTMKIIPNRS